MRFCPACGFALTAVESVKPEPHSNVDEPTQAVSAGVAHISESRRTVSALSRRSLYIGLSAVVVFATGFVILRSGVIGKVEYSQKAVATQNDLQGNPTRTSGELASQASHTPSPGIKSGLSSTNTIQPDPSLTTTTAPTKTYTLIPTLIPSVTITPIPTIVNPLDGAALINIPAGKFSMGSDPDSDPYFWGAEAPIHEVFITEYYVYMLEVTNAQYAKCVTEHQCPRPQQIYSRTRREYYGNPRFDAYPVVYVTYQMAASYCVWAGGRLPSEAEWEKAARSTDGRLFPWGSALPSADLANYNGTGVGDTNSVGSYPSGASPYGVLDMGGNVLEWTYDLFDKGYYSYSQLDNPFGPSTGSSRVIRGGSWTSGFDGLRTVARASLRPEQSAEMVGFRCAIESMP
jgi:formylglycine-generating enzyme required for sulfatase activity